MCLLVVMLAPCSTVRNCFLKCGTHLQIFHVDSILRGIYGLIISKMFRYAEISPQDHALIEYSVKINLLSCLRKSKFQDSVSSIFDILIYLYYHND